MKLEMAIGVNVDDLTMIVKAVDLNNGKTYLQLVNGLTNKVLDEGEVEGALSDGHILRLNVGLMAIDIRCILPTVPIDKTLLN